MFIIDIDELANDFENYIDILEKNNDQEIIIVNGNKRIARMTAYNKPRLGCGKDILETKEFKLKEGFEDINESFGY